MMISATGPRPGRDAASLRFLALCLGGWALLRAADEAVYSAKAGGRNIVRGPMRRSA